MTTPPLPLDIINYAIGHVSRNLRISSNNVPKQRVVQFKQSFQYM